MSSIPVRWRHHVVRRARDHCEYGGLAQEGHEATFHIDHIAPRSIGGATSRDNLALVCVSCSLRKQARRSGLDPQTGRRIALFHARRQRWADHFRWEGYSIFGLTPTGRATVNTLQMTEG